MNASFRPKKTPTPGSVICPSRSPPGSRVWVRHLTDGGTIKKMLLSHFARTVRRTGIEPLHADYYYGILDTGRMTLRALRRILRELPDGVTEINLHPGGWAVLPSVDGEEGLAGDYSPADRRFLRRPERAAELAALLDARLHDELRTLTIELKTFRDLCTESNARHNLERKRG